jgi:hypothetical protein
MKYFYFKVEWSSTKLNLYLSIFNRLAGIPIAIEFSELIALQQH